jgi:hypothetical protein
MIAPTFDELQGQPRILVVYVTPEIAEKWLANYLYHHQRSMRSWQVEALAREMQQGTFIPDTVIRFSVEPSGVSIIDGQHRLQALIRSGCSQRFVVVFTPSETPVQTASMYGHIDLSLRRTMSDLFATLELDRELGLTVTQINLVSTAVAFMADNFNRNRGVSRSSAVQWIRIFAKPAQRYFLTIAGRDRSVGRPALRSATLSVALATYMWSTRKYGGERIDDFWHGALLDDGLAANDPRKHVYRHLLTVGMPGGGTLGDKTSSPGVSARFIAYCFNMFIRNRQLTIARPPSADQPIAISGTPYNGKSTPNLFSLLERPWSDSDPNAIELE